MKLFSNGKERIVPLHPELGKMLLERKAQLGNSFDPEEHIAKYITDTLSTYFRRAIEQAGIDKPRAVHILRHTAATALLETGANLCEVQESLAHSDVTTTQLYTHIAQKNLSSAVRWACLGSSMRPSRLGRRIRSVTIRFTSNSRHGRRCSCHGIVEPKSVV